MIAKRAFVSAAASVLILAATSGLVMAHGFGPTGAGGHDIWLLARAAGLNRSQIASAFENDANLKSDRGNFKTAQEAMMTCLVSGKACTSQISSFFNALQTM